MKQINYFLVAVFLVGCGDKSEAKPNVSAVEIGEGVFNIPSKYVLSGLPSSMFPKNGLDKSDGISLKIPYADLGVISSNEGGLEDNLIVLLSSLGEYLRDFGVSVDANNAWKGVEIYSDRIVIKDENTSLYRVGSKAAFPMFWHYFTASPVEKNDVKKHWIASCYEANAGMPTCAKQVVFKGTQSKLTVSGKNIQLLGRIEKSYYELLTSWQE